jgi:hypothetical protein
MPLILNGSTGISGTDGSAATPAVQGTDTNTGMYFPGADRIGFAEGGVQVGEFDASSNFLFNSGYGSVAVAYGCRAWVNFNGTGTVAIRASGNVSSITDNAVGNYTVNFTTAMPDVNYCAVFGGENIAGVGNAILNGSGTRATGSIGLLLTDFANNSRDDDAVQVAIFR